MHVELIFFHDRIIRYFEQMPTRILDTRMDDLRKDHPDTERLKKNETPKQL